MYPGKLINFSISLFVSFIFSIYNSIMIVCTLYYKDSESYRCSYICICFYIILRLGSIQKKQISRSSIKNLSYIYLYAENIDYERSQ